MDALRSAKLGHGMDKIKKKHLKINHTFAKKQMICPHFYAIIIGNG